MYKSVASAFFLILSVISVALTPSPSKYGAFSFSVPTVIYAMESFAVLGTVYLQVRK